MDRNEAVPDRWVLQPLLCSCQAKRREIPFEGRGTIVVMFVHRDGLLIAQMARGGDWMPPQGGILEHETLIDAAFREMLEEIEFTPDRVARDKRVTVLGQCVNPIPPERRVEARAKHLVFVALPVWDRSWPKPNQREVTQCVWVENPGHLQTLIGKRAQSRSVKYRAICNAVDMLKERGFISWGSGLGTAGT